MGLPVSRVIVVASASSCATTAARKRVMHASRSAMGRAAQAGCAARAAAVLAATETASSAGIVSIMAPVEGLWMCRVGMVGGV